MAKGGLFIIVSLFTIPCSIFAFRGNTTFSDPILNVLFNPPKAKCGSVSCSFPCIGAAPPGLSRASPDCPSGCACVVDCRRKAVVCFETKDCAERKKLFRRTKKPKS